MAELAVQFIVLEGVVPAPLVAADAAGDSFDNDGFTHLEVVNANVGVTRDVVVTGQRLLPAKTSATRTITVPISGTVKIGPFPKELFNTDLKSEVEVTYPDATDLTVGAFSVKDANN